MLYALPDHEVMENLLPGIRDSHLPVAEAVERIRNRPGLVPIAVNPEGGGLVYFADIGDAPLKEWKHIYTIERLAGENMIDDRFVTDLAVLEHDDAAADGIAPTGLIFHVSRCGSTLFTKALARSPANLCINQGGPLQEGFWAAITDHWRHDPEPDERNLRMFRNLVLLMTRKRRPEYRRSFVKFISWNIIYQDFIRAAFPDAAPLFIYRNPLEVIATVLQETTAVLRARGTQQARSLTGLSAEETAQMSDVEYLACCYAHYFAVALAAGEANALHVVNYEQLKYEQAFADILSVGLEVRPDSQELEQMREQYHFYSKDDSDKTVYTGDSEDLLDVLSAEDRQTIQRICDTGLERLNQSKCNIFRSR